MSTTNIKMFFDPHENVTYFKFEDSSHPIYDIALDDHENTIADMKVYLARSHHLQNITLLWPMERSSPDYNFIILSIIVLILLLSLFVIRLIIRFVRVKPKDSFGSRSSIFEPTVVRLKRFKSTSTTVSIPSVSIDTMHYLRDRMNHVYNVCFFLFT